MSRMATSEYIGARRRACAEAKPDRRRRILDEACETTDHSRKYANRLLTGSRKFREHKGRGRTYTQEAADLLRKVWLEAGRPCLPYFKADTFALGGGDPSDNFFWILDATDRKTQWTVLSPAWNRGRHATPEALEHVESKFPFRIASPHCDNGGEILNHHLAARLGSRPESPFRRLLDESALSPERRRRLEAYRAGLGGMEFHRRVFAAKAGLHQVAGLD